MKKIITALLSVAVLTVTAQDNPNEELLKSIERNNLTLRAGRELMDVRILEARSGNTLSDPTVGYDYLWGSPSEVGKTGELNIVQGFEFPTVYGSRNKHSEALSHQFEAEQDVLRREVLLQARLTIIELCHLRQRSDVLSRIVTNAEKLSVLFSKKLEAGNANILETNKVDLELMSARNALSLNEIDYQACLAQLEELNGGVALGVDLLPVADQPLPALPALEDVMSLCVNADPRLNTLRKAAKAAECEVDVKRGEAMPRFEVGYRREHALGENFSGVKMGMTVPLFESRYTVKRARAGQKAAQTMLRNVESSVEIELRRLHSRAALLLDAYDQRRTVMTPERNEELLNTALETGQISAKDYFMEMEGIFRLRNSVMEVERDYRKAVAELMSWEL